MFSKVDITVLLFYNPFLINNLHMSIQLSFFLSP